jgi:hypothetical protein
MADEVQIGVNDPGLGLVDEATSLPFIYGPCSGGTANLLESFNSIPDLVTAHPQGPAVEQGSLVLGNGGGPIRFMKSATSVAAANTAVTKTPASGPDVTISGSANDYYDAWYEVMKAGALGAGRVRYTLDGGKTFSEEFDIPAGGTHALPGTGITATFAAGSYVLGVVYSFKTTPAMWNSTDLAACFNVIANDFLPWDFFAGAGRHASGAAAATIGAALQSQLAGLTSSHRYVRGVIDAGDEAAAAIATAFASTTTPRVAYAYRGLRRPSKKPMVGWGSPMLGGVDGFALLAAQSLISTDIARYASNNLGVAGASEIDYDEEKSAALDAARISALRTFPGVSGFWFKNGRLKAAPGSDFQFWQFGRVMDVACRTTYLSSLPFVNTALRTITGGRLDPRDINRVETRINSQLDAVLKQPINAEGFKGHVTEIRYSVDRMWNAQATQALKGEISIVALAYAKKVKTTLGYTQFLPVLAEAA